MRTRNGYSSVLAFLVPIITLGFCGAPSADEAATTLLTIRYRGPVALALLDQGMTLLTANRRSGSISIVDTATGAVTREVAIGKKLSALVLVPSRDLLLATDEAAHELLLLAPKANSLSVISRLAVPEYPVSVEVSHDGARCYVASLWSRRLSIFDIEPAAGSDHAAQLKLSRVIPLSFAPRKQLLIEGEKRLLVADAFGGKLAVIDTELREIESLHELPAHNIRGLAANDDGSRLLVSHQILNSLARTTPDDVHWGMLMGNVVRSLTLANVLDKKADVLRGSIAHPVGQAGNAAADPGAIALTASGEIAVVMSGVGEVGFFPEDDATFRRVSLGGRPTELVVSPDRSRVYVADEMSDTISVIDVKEGRRVAEISLGPQPELTLADRGERLFYSGRLSHDGWMSCHSCHTDGHSNGLLNDNLGDGSFGAPKRVLSLLGVGQSGPWAWKGDVTELETQIKKSIETTMRGKTPRDEDVQALAAYLKTLVPAPSPISESQRDAAAIQRGRILFEARHCDRCHAPPSYTSEATYDVGLKDEFNHAKFNPPSLRGVGQRDALFHDNRAANLEEVFVKFKHLIEDDLSEADLADLMVFLRNL